MIRNLNFAVCSLECRNEILDIIDRIAQHLDQHSREGAESADRQIAYSRVAQFLQHIRFSVRTPTAGPNPEDRPLGKWPD